MGRKILRICLFSCRNFDPKKENGAAASQENVVKPGIGINRDRAGRKVVTMTDNSRARESCSRAVDPAGLEMDCTAYGHFLLSRSLRAVDSVKDMRVVLAVPATANRKFCICGVNSRRSGTFWAKQRAQYPREQT